MSVLFVDLVGFTSWSEAQDPEDARELLSGYFSLARTVVGRYGGVVEKFIGDAVMAVWGAPVAREDDAERAVRAGLELVGSVPSIGQRHGSPGLRARGGVVTGQVMSWANPGEGLVVGDRVNTAARVQSAAQPSTVLVDELTRQVTQAAVAYVDAGSHSVKGKSEVLQLWRAERVVAGVGGVQRVQGLEAAFVGRGRELSVVKELFHASAEEGRARLVSVLGAAGVGKSRLGWEFEKYADGLADTVWWHRGRCLSYGEGVAFWALVEMFRQRLGIAEDDRPEAAAGKLAARLPEWVPDEQERAFIGPRLAVLVGAGGAGGVGGVELGREELFAGWRLFLERLAEAQPVVLLIENVQWADSGLLDFLEYLLEWSTESALFILTLARPELAESRPGWLAGRRDCVPLNLGPLPDLLLGELLQGLVPGLPAEVSRRIVATAQGVPLYAVELVRSMLDRGLVTADGGGCAVAADVGGLDVPQTLTSLITSRLDGLPAAERGLVKDLAVLGDSFPASSVAAISHAPPERVKGLLDGLVGREILTRRADPLSPDRGQYTFVQTLLRSVAHNMLTKRERKTGHLAVAEHLQTAFANGGEEVAELIAAHYLQAYHAAPAEEQDQLREQTVHALARAGHRAGQVGAPDTAENHYRSAADLSTDEQQQASLTASAADMAKQAGRDVDALTLYQTAERLHTSAGRDLDAAALAARIGLCHAYTGNAELGITGMRAALPTLSSAGDDARLAELHAELARALWATGHGDEALQYAEQALAAAQRLDLPQIASRALMTKAFRLSDTGCSDEALTALQAAVEIAARHSLLRQEMMARGNLGATRADLDLPGHVEDFESALALARKFGDRTMEGWCLTSLASAHIWYGDWEKAESHARQALDVIPQDQGTDALAVAHLYLVWLCARQGRTEEALHHLAAVEALGTSDEIQVQGFLLTARAMTAAAEDDDSQAFDYASEATQLTHQTFGLINDPFRLAWPLAVEAALALGRYDRVQELLTLVSAAPPATVPPYLRGQMLRLQALLASRTQPGDNIEADLRAAITIMNDLGYPYWRARIQLDLGTWLNSTGQAHESATVVQQALTTLEILGAQPLIAKAHQLLSAMSK